MPRPNISGRSRDSGHQGDLSSQVPADEGGDADQHDEGVVVDVAGLEADHAAGHVEHAGGDPVRAHAVDDAAVALLPEELPKPLAGRTKIAVVELVEVPLVEQEPVQARLLGGELAAAARAGGYTSSRRARSRSAS